MKRVGYFYNEIFLEHDCGSGHPESPRRLEAINEALDGAPFAADIQRFTDFPARAPGSLEAVHEKGYIKWVANRIESGARVLDFGDTQVGARSYLAALKAADAAVDAAHRVWHGELDRAFVAPRPPGHHAEADRAMGFCIFNNIAVAAAWLLREGARKVAIVDWDVHHGNGTQHTFYADPQVLFISLHQYPHYPGTGAGSERGEGEGEGSTINLPMRAGSGDEEYLQAFDGIVIPALEEYGPEAILVSAGFDGHRSDPLAGIALSTEAYGEMTRLLCEASGRLCGGRLVSVLEGGYNLGALAEVALVHVGTMLE